MRPGRVAADPVVIRLPTVWSRAERNIAIAAAVSAMAFVVAVTLALFGIANPPATANRTDRPRTTSRAALEQTFANTTVPIVMGRSRDGTPRLAIVHLAAAATRAW